MISGDGGSIMGGQGDITVDTMKKVQADNVQEPSAERESSVDAFQADQAEQINPFAKKLTETRKPSKTRFQKVQASTMGADKTTVRIPVGQAKNLAQQYQQRNPELKAKMLLLLKEYLKPSDSKEEILKKVMEFYEDPALADEALEFLMETSEGVLNLNIKEAKEELNAKFGREIAAGRNMGTVARQAADKGLGAPTTLRDLYRDITGNPREANQLFAELSGKWAYKELNKVIKFLMHSLGADLNSAGPSIPPGLLHNLLNEARTLQAILGVYSFFRERMDLMQKLFARNGLMMPSNLTFEQMAKQFMDFVSDRYPSSDKALQTASKLGIEKWIMAKIIALSQLRDAIREVAANKIFKSTQHRDDCYLAILEALEDLEDELEELEEKEQEKRDLEQEEIEVKREREEKREKDTIH